MYGYFFHPSPDLLFVFDNEFRIIDLNNDAAEKLQYSIEELQGKSIYNLYPVETRSDIKKYLDEMLAGKKDFLVHLRHKDRQKNNHTDR